MKKIAILLPLLLVALGGFACPACEKQQPALLKGISHGSGPESNWDMVIVWVIAIIVVLTLFFSIKFLVKPGEKSKSHIKRFILSND
ncbi:hypothetical protein [Albibacterium sp.]|uniref:hypothetical protein n=1 Tax=Albibacterium sp. TaxID=2952885 RepID=UPI002B531B95|nr:hypothetical protein [Albibacterium sp.]HUH19075.1 hypothetical protein [Albibacterium sp.]